MERESGGIAGKIIAAVFLLVSATFVGLLVYTKLIPTVIVAVVAVVLLIFVILITILTWNQHNIVRFVIGTILAVLFSGLFIAGGVYLYKTTSTLSKISGVETEIAQVGIYVRAQDSADSLNATSGYKYGIITDLDRENTDKTLEEIKSELGTEIQVQEYRGLTELIDGLRHEETGAIILNQAYIPVLEEIDGYGDIGSQIREISVKNVETVIETVNKPSENENAGTQVQAETETTGEIYTVYISGIDNRGGLVAKSRSDVNIIAVANTKTRQLLLVSTPRDYFVPLSISGGVPDKLTHAGIYGISVSMDTLGMLYGIDINNYFRINFGGFINIIDALGGITVESDYDFSTSGFHYNKGSNYVNGEQALAFARERYSFSGGDRQRGKNQMAVIQGVINKALSPELLKNYSSILSSLQGSFETNISYEEIARLLQQQLTEGGAWNIVSYSVDGTGDKQKPYSMSQPAYVMIPDYNTVDTAKEMIQQVKNGQTIAQPQG
ncbi:MAG: LCP family protein [Eubacteriales bacterium]|nr:LCP family protein [Eubacteriales bacterium]